MRRLPSQPALSERCAKPYNPILLSDPHSFSRRLFFTTSPADPFLVGSCRTVCLCRNASPDGKDEHMSKSKSNAAVIDRRAKKDRRQDSERRVEGQPVAVERRKLQRREKVIRRRQIDPTTCERDYSNDEVEFMHALDAYKRTSGRMFPTCSEVLEVLRDLGYAKLGAATASEPTSATPIEQL
jgi:hypothetical protein